MNTTTRFSHSIIFILVMQTTTSFVSAADVPTVGAAADAEGKFLAENKTVMAHMMTAMHDANREGVDRDFVRMMIPHHQAAVDMAVIYLRNGNNENLRRLAQGIVVEQQQEIVTMRQAIGDPVESTSGSSTESDATKPVAPGAAKAMAGMETKK